MTKYRATSESGRVYVVEWDADGFGTWHTEPDSGYGGPIRGMQVVDRFWDQRDYEYPHQQGQPATRPEVGKSLYLGTSIDNWRLSTEIVSVEEVAVTDE